MTFALEATNLGKSYGRHEALIDWGDGSPQQSFSGRAVDVTHLYGAGSYTITVTVTDDDGGTQRNAVSVPGLPCASRNPLMISGPATPVQDARRQEREAQRRLRLIRKGEPRIALGRELVRARADGDGGRRAHAGHGAPDADPQHPVVHRPAAGGRRAAPQGKGELT